MTLVIWLLQDLWEEVVEECEDGPGSQEGEELKIIENKYIYMYTQAVAINLRACERNVSTDKTTGAATTFVLRGKCDSGCRWLLLSKAKYLKGISPFKIDRRGWCVSLIA